MIELRVFSSMHGSNDGTRSLLDSVLVPEVKHTLQQWHTANAESKAVLIGGIALSFYVKPRTTEDADFLYLSETDIPTEVVGFKKMRAHSFRENRTHVEVDYSKPLFNSCFNL